MFDCVFLNLSVNLLFFYVILLRTIFMTSSCLCSSISIIFLSRNFFHCFSCFVGVDEDDVIPVLLVCAVPYS